MSTSDNPCLTCTINQGCCTNLTGLCLTKTEYERCFVDHTDQIIVQRQGPLYIVSQADGNACPNWQGSGCTVYDERPRECALFPHTLYLREQRGDKYTLCVHSDTHCPQKKQLASSQDDAEELVLEFAKEAFGDSASITVRGETSMERVSRSLKNSASKLISAVRR